MQTKMKIMNLKFGIILLAGMSFATPSHADDISKAVKSCMSAIQTGTDLTEGSNPKASYKLKSVSGASVKKLKFVSKGGKGKPTLICKYKRGKVKDITDSDDVSLMPSGVGKS